MCTALSKRTSHPSTGPSSGRYVPISKSLGRSKGPEAAVVELTGVAGTCAAALSPPVPVASVGTAILRLSTFHVARLLLPSSPSMTTK